MPSIFVLKAHSACKKKSPDFIFLLKLQEEKVFEEEKSYSKHIEQIFWISQRYDIYLPSATVVKGKKQNCYIYAETQWKCFLLR